MFPQGESAPFQGNLEIFYLELARVRKVFGWSYAHMAKEMDVAGGTIIAWEHRHYPPPCLDSCSNFRSRHAVYRLKKLIEVTRLLEEYRARCGDWEYLTAGEPKTEAEKKRK